MKGVEGHRGVLRGFEGRRESGIARYVSVCENCCAGFETIVSGEEREKTK